MEGGGNVVGLAGELARAVEVIMNPHTSPQERTEAYIACEKFKEASPLCAPAGLYLASGCFSPEARHFGLQLMEHTVKFNWNSISQQEKLFIKENSMKLLCMGVGPAEDQSITHIKDALSRVIVEMVKREWPQQWTTLLSELSDACSNGEAQTELVLFIFLRLVEDVALLQTIESNQRRKDIYQALTVNMTEIFDFFLRLIELHVSGFRNASSSHQQQKALAHSRVVQVVLLTLTGFVEWVSIVHIMASEGRLLHILCILLTDVSFQLPAAECLLQIVNRKGQLKDRKPLLLLFSEEAINYIYRSATQSSQNSDPAHSYMFLKKLVQVVSGLGGQITALYGKEDGTMQRPAHFTTFLETVFVFTQHQSLTICHYASIIWTMLLKHEQISKDSVFLEYVAKVIEIVGPKVIKIGYPSSRSIEIRMTPETFASIDYDSEEEFTVFFQRCRTDFLEIFRQATLIAPRITFRYCEHWLSMRLQKAVNEANTTCSVQDPVYLEWEALVQVLEGVLSRILLVSDRPPVANGLRLLEDCLKIETRDPLIFSILLSSISALFVFLSMSSCQITAGNCVAMSGVSLLPRVLEKIFSGLVFADNNTVANVRTTRSVAVKSLRRHAASLMVKLGIKYPLLLLPVFDQINSTVQGLIKQPQQLSKMEQIVLHEALLVISNHFCEFERQSNFIGEVIREGQSQWAVLGSVLKSAPDFVRFVGLDKAPYEPIESDPNAANRIQLIHALNIVLGVVRRCSWPDDPDRASRGGFVVALTESGNPICRNPAASHVLPLLHHILLLLRVMNELFNRQAMSLLSDGYKNAYAMLEVEKKALMGIPPVFVDPMDPTIKKAPTPLDKMQQYINTLFDNCYHMMGSAGPSLGRDLYQMPGIADALINSAFACLENVPDHRLRPIIRVFLKPFVYSCPPAFYDSVIIPIFAHIAPFMHHRLNNRWKYITSLYESGELGEDVSDTQEVLEDMLNRTFTREYLEVLKVALVGGTITTADTTTSDAAMDHDDLSMDGATHALTRAAQTAMASEVISELGAKLLRNEHTCAPIVLTILSSQSWNDSTSALKGVFLTVPILRFLAAEQLLSHTLASNVLIAALQGLQVHGQHDTNQSALITLGVQVYEILRPKFPHILDIMHQIPNTNVADIQKLDEKIQAGASTKGNKIDKSKKDLFKKITAQLIGRSIGQLFRKEIKIANLPPLPRHNGPMAGGPHHTDNLVESNQEIGISRLFSANS